MFLARPDYEHNKSEVLISFEQALEIIKVADNLTQGIQKIVYLVGWQGLGHDDTYPEMEVVNDALRREADASASDSLWWLFEEAKKYHTVISFHGNLADAYDATPCVPALIRANGVVNDVDGHPAVIEIFNGRNAYKTSYKGFWESGLFHKIWNRFCEVTPVRQAGTVHLDNFCIAQSLNPRTNVEEEDMARNRMLDYIASLGIDVTTEYTYRELEWRADSPEHPIRSFYATGIDPLPVGRWQDAPIRTLGRIPTSWWTSNITMDECMEIPPAIYSGHLTDVKQLAVFYGAMHGEDIWMAHGTDPAAWADEFLYQFCTLQLPYFYLNRLQRLSYTEDDGGYTVLFSKGVVSRGKDGRITKSDAVLKDGDDVLLPLERENRTFIAYSKNGKNGEWDIPDAGFRVAEAEEITCGGNVPLGKVIINNGKVSLNVKAGRAIVLHEEEK